MGVSAPAHSAPALFSWLDTTKIGISFAGFGMVFFFVNQNHKLVVIF
jgi:hypothetical protein